MPRLRSCGSSAAHVDVLGKPSERHPQRNIVVIRMPPVGGVSVITLIRSETTLDLSQKAEKVWEAHGGARGIAPVCETQTDGVALGDEGIDKLVSLGYWRAHISARGLHSRRHGPFLEEHSLRLVYAV